MNGKIRKFLLLMWVMPVLLTGAAESQSFAKYAGEFLTLGAGARAQALGSAFTSVADDASASFWNPAGLVQLKAPQAILMHAEQFAGEVSYDFAGFSAPYGKNSAFGISLIRLGVDGIPDTRNALIDSVQTNGRIDAGERLQFDRITWFSNSDMALLISAAHKKSDKLFIGGNVKLIRRSLGDNSAWGVGFDAAALYRFSERLNFGAVLMNATSTLLAWDTGRKEWISPLLKTGASYYWDVPGISAGLRPIAEVDIRFEGRDESAQAAFGAASLDFHYGAEFDIMKRFFFRSGVDDIGQLSFGAGVKLRQLVVDYAFTSFDDLNSLGDSHRVSVNVYIPSVLLGK